VALSEGIPRPKSAAAERGSRGHEIAEQILTGEKSFAYFEVFEDEDLLKGVAIYVQLIRSERAKRAGYYEGIEEFFDLSDQIAPNVYGTADYWIYDTSTKLLTVIDYKNGKSKVEVEGNIQLLYYALGCVFKLYRKKDPVETIELVICQPNYGKIPIRRWQMPFMDIFDFIGDLVRDVARTREPNAELKSGQHCFFCPASMICPEKKKERTKKALEEFND
jgi:Protein of unknown function (DUF2800)